jgi:pilus assembly protein CpaC
VKSPLIALALGLAALALHAPTPAHASAQVVGGADSELRMEVGKGRLMRLSHPARTMFIADPKIADVQVKSPTLVYVIGKAPGSTTFFALDAKEQMVANISVNVGFDEGRLRELLRQQAPESRVEVTAANGALILTGKVGSPAEGEDVLRIANLFVQGEDKDKPGQIINRLTIETPTEVYLSVRIAEVNRQATKELGFNWENFGSVGDAGGFLGNSQGADFLSNDGKRVFTRPAGAFGAIVGGIFNPAKGLDINLMLTALHEKNLVNILAEPNLTAKSGEPAFFLAGGEYPIPVPQAQGQTTIEYKKYGVSLSFVATILNGGRISLNVRPEVSELTTTGAITLGNVTVPALTTRQAETTVDLASGQSFAIAGLMQNSVNQDLKKMPGLGDVPVLGQLFRSKTFQRKESELVIIVTPYLVKPTSRRLALPTDPPPLSLPARAVEAPQAPAVTEKKG